MLQMKIIILKWGLGIRPNPQSPIPNPQSPIPNRKLRHFIIHNLKNYLL